jgi:hypothetical protein
VGVVAGGTRLGAGSLSVWPALRCGRACPPEKRPLSLPGI